MGLFSKIGDALKKAGDKIGDVLKKVAPVAATVASSLIPGVGGVVATLGASLINKANAKPTASQTVQAIAAVLSPPTVGIFQGSGAVVKTIAPSSPGKDPMVSIPVNGNGIGITQSTRDIVTAVTSGHIIDASGNVHATVPASLVAVQASQGSNLPAPEPLKKIQAVVDAINANDPQSATNAPGTPTVDFSSYNWRYWLVGGLAALGIVALLFSLLKKRK